MSRFFRYLVVWLASAIVCLVSLVPVIALAITVPGEIVFPLATGFGALCAAIIANALGNYLAPDQTRGRLLPIVGVAEAAGVVVAGALLAIAAFIEPGLPGPLIYWILGSARVIALSATTASALLRTAGGDVEREARITVGLVVLGVLTVIVVPLALCLTVVRCLPY